LSPVKLRFPAYPREKVASDRMSTIVWGWAAAWLIGRLWLEWRVHLT